MSIRTLFFIGLIAGLVFSCNEENSKNKIQESSQEDAELALLMRELHENFKAVRDSIINEGSIDPLIKEKLDRIYTAVPTDPKVKGPVFDGFTNAFIRDVDSLMSSSKGDRIAVFNAAVTSCVNCHQEVCPGPVKTIKKLEIKSP